jgi:hypothetical protein
MLECIPETIHDKEILGLWADLRWYKHCVLIAIHVKHAAVSDCTSGAHRVSFLKFVNPEDGSYK